jgi:HEAT repeat protein
MTTAFGDLTRVAATGLCLGVLLAVGTVGVAIAGPGDERATFIEVTVDRSQLTVDLRHAPLDHVLRLVGERAGVDVTLRGNLTAPVTRSFTDLPLEEGIRRLADGHSVAVTYGATGSGQATLTGVWVMAGGSRTSSLDSGASASRREPADARVADITSESLLADQIGEIQRLRGDAADGSEAALARLADLAASDADAGLRQQAVAALARVKGPLVEQALTEALGDAEASVRVRAVRGLRGTGTETAVASLARASTDDADPEVRLAALSALVSFPGHTMVQGLVRAVADPDGRVRDAAARGLAWWENGAPFRRSVDGTNVPK